MSTPAGYSIRPAIESDRAGIAAFTNQTFAWGDYIDDVWEKWLLHTNGMLFVAVEEATQLPVGIVHVALPSPGEAWLEGARVHPLHRRRGLADALNQTAFVWAVERGATVARLGTEATNEPANRQVSRMGYRAVGWFVYAWAVPEAALRAVAERALGDAASSGGGARATFPVDRGSVRLASAADSASAPRVWRASANQEARESAGGLAGRDWRWSRFGEEEMLLDLREGRVLVHPDGFGVIDLDREPAELRWLGGGAAEIALASVQAAWAVRSERLLAMVPRTAANLAALAGAGFDNPVEMVIYELSLPVVA
jgi:ribosomal protein S18 acetylase RimI-like enzyme